MNFLLKLVLVLIEATGSRHSCYHSFALLTSLSPPFSHVTLCPLVSPVDGCGGRSTLKPCLPPSECSRTSKLVGHMSCVLRGEDDVKELRWMVEA